MTEALITGFISFAFAMLTFILKGVLKENRKLKLEQTRCEKEKEQALEDGVKALLRTKLMETHAEHMAAGSITSYNYENWTLMHEAYSALKGNGMVDHMRNDIEGLHIED